GTALLLTMYVCCTTMTACVSFRNPSQPAAAVAGPSASVRAANSCHRHAVSEWLYMMGGLHDGSAFWIMNNGARETCAAQSVYKKVSGTFAGTARRVLRTKVPDPFLNTLSAVGDDEDFTALVQVSAPAEHDRCACHLTPEGPPDRFRHDEKNLQRTAQEFHGFGFVD